MIFVYVNLPVPNFTIHTAGCGFVPQHFDVTINDDVTLNTELQRLTNNEYPLAARAGQNGLWFEIALGSRDENEAVVRNIQQIMENHYPTLADAQIRIHRTNNCNFSL